MTIKSTNCDDPKYQQQVLNAHQISSAQFEEAVYAFWKEEPTEGNSFSADELSNLLSSGSCGNSLLLCTGSHAAVDDVVLDLVASSGQPVPPIPIPPGSFACIYSYDLLYATLSVHQPDVVVFYKASLPTTSRAIIFKAIKNGQDVYLADVVNTLP